MVSSIHKPVLLNEVLEILNPQPGEKFIDGTVNGGGHARAILERVGGGGEVLGIDRDCDLIRYLEKTNRELKADNFKTVCGNYENIQSLAAKYNFLESSGVLLDLGFSSYHIEESGRGFSFLKDEPLDMRYDKMSGQSADTLVNTASEEKLEEIIRVYGEDRYSRMIARGIAIARREHHIKTTYELREIIFRAIPGRFRQKGIHPATRTFQALRIAINQELEVLERALPESVSILKTGGVIAIISFHSLEDRIVKNFFKNQEKEEVLKIITKKPITVSESERRSNPRSRSAKLRAARKV